MNNKKLENKIIIRNYTKLDDIDALSYVGAVIEKSKGLDKYSYCTVFNDEIIVFAKERKETGTYTFYIFYLKYIKLKDNKKLEDI